MKKKLALIGMIAGIAMIFIGLLTMCGAFSGSISYGGSSPYSSGYASFGADYYTYSVNNSAETASAARAAAQNVGDVLDFIQVCGGLFLMLFGLMAFCGFGIVHTGCPNEKAVKAEETVVVTNEENETPAVVETEEEACAEIIAESEEA